MSLERLGDVHFIGLPGFGKHWIPSSVQPSSSLLETSENGKNSTHGLHLNLAFVRGKLLLFSANVSEILYVGSVF